jgi:hypothetical protein
MPATGGTSSTREPRAETTANAVAAFVRILGPLTPRFAQPEA